MEKERILSTFPSKDPATAFYNDVLSPSIQHEWINRLYPTPYAVLASEVEYNCCQAETVPCSYLIGESDNVVPPAFARAMIGSVRKDGTIDTEVVYDSGHSPWLTRVEDVVRLVRKAAGEEVEVPAGKVDDKGARWMVDAVTLRAGEDAFDLR